MAMPIPEAEFSGPLKKSGLTLVRRKRRGAFGAKLDIIRAAGYPIRLAPREPRSLRESMMVERADAVWQARIRLARAERGVPVRLPYLADVASIDLLRAQVSWAELALTELVRQVSPATS